MKIVFAISEPATIKAVLAPPPMTTTSRNGLHWHERGPLKESEGGPL
jgi:hypothetical protein